MEQNIIAVSQVNEYIKFLLDRDELLGNICVRGELSNYKVYPSGHHYFTLKDAEGALRCVMFRSSAQRRRCRPENGMQVIASGRVTVFPRDGAYQLYCNTLTADGAGDLYVAFEQLKEKLAKEGLFDPAHKKPIPKYPHTIAIITSAAGAAIMDMLRILGKRYPLTKVKLLPVRVQGAEAPAEIAGAIRYANRYQVADLIITGRGGGSMEDLWDFCIRDSGCERGRARAGRDDCRLRRRSSRRDAQQRGGACRAGPAGAAEKAADDAGFHAAERAEKREARPPAAFRAGRKARAAEPAQLSGGPPGPARFSFDPSAGGRAEDAA